MSAVMNPVRKALDRWKKSQPENSGTVEGFAKVLGYKQADTVYRLMRDEVEPPGFRQQIIAEMAGLPLGTVTRYFAENVKRKSA
jgi:hypothetical protein